MSMRGKYDTLPTYIVILLSNYLKPLRFDLYRYSAASRKCCTITNVTRNKVTVTKSQHEIKLEGWGEVLYCAKI